MARQPDIIASVRFYPAEKGGRAGATAATMYRCPMQFGGTKYDCGLHLDVSGPIAPGGSALVPITFLSPELIKPRLKVGSKFTLWERKNVAEGVVVSVLPD